MGIGSLCPFTNFSHTVKGKILTQESGWEVEESLAGTSVSWNCYCWRPLQPSTNVFCFLNAAGQNLALHRCGVCSLFCKASSISIFCFSLMFSSLVKRHVYGNTATEITGGALSALVSALLMLLTSGLIEELALLLLLHAPSHYGAGYPWRRCLYDNEHLVCDSVRETLGGVGQMSTRHVCNCLF